MENTLTKAMRRDIASLAGAKGRRKLGAFMAEGTKCVLDTVEHFALRRLVATADWLASHPLPAAAAAAVTECRRCDIAEMTSMSLAPDVIAVYDLPEAPEFRPEDFRGRLAVALDRVQDPGNIGTIMRTADWMGADIILASHDTVDCFNPKAIQATMGAISRVKVVYGDLPAMLGAMPAGVEIFGTFLDGENIYTAHLPEAGVIVMGNEGSGISAAVAAAVGRRILIPSYPADRATSESLNVATATAIALSQFRARSFGGNR